MFYLYRIKRSHVDWNWPNSREKYVKIDWAIKMSLHWLIMRVADSWKSM